MHSIRSEERIATPRRSICNVIIWTLRSGGRIFQLDDSFTSHASTTFQKTPSCCAVCGAVHSRYINSCTSVDVMFVVDVAITSIVHNSDFSSSSWERIPLPSRSILNTKGNQQADCGLSSECVDDISPTRSIACGVRTHAFDQIWRTNCNSASVYMRCDNLNSAKRRAYISFRWQFYVACVDDIWKDTLVLRSPWSRS